MSSDDARGLGEVLYDARRSAPYDRNGWDTLSSNSQRFWCEQAEQVLASPQFARLIEQREAAARAEGRREVREAAFDIALSRIEAAADNIEPTMPHRAGAVIGLDIAAEIVREEARAVLAGQGGESGEGA